MRRPELLVAVVARRASVVAAVAVAVAVARTPAVAAAAHPAADVAIERALRAGQYESALRLSSARARDATPGRARLAARALVALGRYAEARRALEDATAAAPDDLPRARRAHAPGRARG